MNPRHPKARAFTLIELLVVVAIVGVLVAILLPTISASREAARRTLCKSHLRQVGIALYSHHEQHRHFPAGSSNEWSWNGRILPFLEQLHISDSLDFLVEPFEPPNDEYTGTVLPILLCPSDPNAELVHSSAALSAQQFAHTNFLGTYDGGNATSRGMFGRNIENRVRKVRDGTSNTLFVGERGVVLEGPLTHGWWCWGGLRDTYVSAAAGFRPGDSLDAASASHFWSFHPDGAFFLFVDGSVHFLSYSIEDAAFKALASKDAGDPVPEY